MSSKIYKYNIRQLLQNANTAPKKPVSRLSNRLPTFSERNQKRIENGKEPQKKLLTRSKQASMNMQPLILSGNELSKKFSLKYIKKISVGISSIMPWSVNHGVVAFYMACLRERQHISKNQEGFILPIELEFLPDYSAPRITIEYEYDRILKFEDASYMAPETIQELMYVKKMKITRFKRIMGETYYDSEDEEPGEKLFPTEQA